MPTFLSGTVPIRLQSHKPDTPGQHPALILFHGSGGNVDRWLQHIAPAVNAMGVALFAVHYFDRTKTTRADPAMIQDGIHFPLWLDTAKDALSHIAAMPDVDARRIGLIGISLGAFLALALATEAKPIRVVIDVSGGLAEPWSARATSAFPHTLILHGEADMVVPVSYARDLGHLLTRLDVRHQTLLLPNENHWFSPPALLRMLATILAFLKANL
ncbi:MAG: alpha/beta hydrolase family protein [Janthinobacterium lividum]